jgi:hypothetical protein
MFKHGLDEAVAFWGSRRTSASGEQGVSATRARGLADPVIGVIHLAAPVVSHILQLPQADVGQAVEAIPLLVDGGELGSTGLLGGVLSELFVWPEALGEREHHKQTEEWQDNALGQLDPRLSWAARAAAADGPTLTSSSVRLGEV